jgi:hypothetical protein
MHKYTLLSVLLATLQSKTFAAVCNRLQDITSASPVVAAPTTVTPPTIAIPSPTPKLTADTIPGVSTRYWDCAKPSCGWNGKALVTKPVRSCAIDGKTSVAADAVNSITGGPAYTCYDQQAFIDPNDPNHAFAFVGAIDPIKPTEADICCTCVHMTFTSGIAKGKTMTAQVTNAGGTGAAHFDIMVAGGGMGEFTNVCPVQFGVSEAALGDRYGGITDISGCSVLPAELQSGCHFRFNFLGNNPTFDYEYVACPKTLTDISGCERL